MNNPIELLLIVGTLQDELFLKDLLLGINGQIFVKSERKLSNGLKRLDQEHFDLVILDLDLPDNQGLEAASVLRQQFESIPVVALTGLADEEFALEALKIDLQDYLIKGQITKEQLIRAIYISTGQKRNIEELRKSEKMYRTLFDSIDEGYCVIEMLIEPGKPLDYKFIEINSAFEKQSTLRDAKGKWMRELRPDHEEYWFEIYRDVALTGKSIRFEQSGKALKGRKFTLYAFRIGPPLQRQVAVLFKDITSQWQTERALSKSEQLLRLFIEHAPAALAMFDRDMRYLHASRRWSLAHGLQERDLTGLSTYEVLNIPEHWKEAHRRGLAGEVLRAEEDRYEAADGSVKWMCWEIHPWYNMHGAIGGIVIFVEDITARKQAEEQLKALNEALELRVEQRTRELQETQLQYLHAEKLSALGKLSASFAHEFNNPLQSVMTVLKGLSKSNIPEEEDRRMLNLAIDESVRMKNLIISLQHYNRPSPGQKALMDVHAAMDSLLLLCKSDFQLKGISVFLNYSEELPHIKAIPDQIKQVFFNLLNNATDACRNTGGRISIRTWKEGKNVTISINDNGTGIKPEKMDLIFRPFYTTKPEVKGTGLGLSVCYGIVQNHKGEIRVESQPGKGSTFTVLLPVNGA